MVPLTALWLPIVLSAVIVFVASSIIHMLLPYHRSDFRQIPQEDSVRAALRSAGLRRGTYAFPYCKMEEMKSPAMVEKYKQGPVGHLTVFPSGPPSMPKYLAMWFLFLLVISFFVAYVAGRTVAPGAGYMVVFRVVGTVGFIAYGLSNLRDSIWRGELWTTTLKELADGLVYGLLTAGTFGWLWPH